ncbi:class I adenylate-forming enzyme family protein [Psychrobacillus sp. NPDC096426]|uniref:class I adenylate-forming enzyme family protein n=1 Tax=Psychrobacillus sp. NPDC096426 TaxID=3364491 RepID=UPI0037FF0E43
MVQKLKVEKSVERLLSRDDVRLSRDQVNHYLNTGQWGVKSFVDYLEQHAESNPNKVAITDENGKKTTYSQLHHQTEQFALTLLELGIQPEDRIALQLPNCSELVISLMGAAKASILPVFCHMPYIEHDLDYVIGLTEAKAIVIPDSFNNKNYIDMIRSVQEKHPCLKHIIVVSDKEYEGTINFYDLLQKEIKSPSSKLEEVRPVGTDPFFIMFTSGTTGKPKAVYHLHANNLFYIETLNEQLSIPKNGKMLAVPPLAHLTGLAFGVLTTLHRGGSVVLLSSWNVKKAVDLIENEKPTHFLGVTPMLIDLARYEGLETRDISSLKNIIYAGAPCPAEILNIYTKKYNCEIIAFYGYSEAGLTHGTRAGDDVAITSTSFGKAAKGIEAKIVDEFGTELQAPCEGEVVVRGANFIPGYYRQPQNNTKAFDAEGWFHSSDIVRMDENGYCTFLARKDDLINRGGYKIDPREIEETLYGHPMISQIAVIAMPDERLGERIAAFVILKDNSKELSLADITAYLSEKGLNKKNWPEAVRIVDSFPMTASGKIQRFAMREQAKELKLAK